MVPSTFTRFNHRERHRTRRRHRNSQTKQQPTTASTTTSTSNHQAAIHSKRRHHNNRCFALTFPSRPTSAKRAPWLPPKRCRRCRGAKCTSRPPQSGRRRGLLGGGDIHIHGARVCVCVWFVVELLKKGPFWFPYPKRVSSLKTDTRVFFLVALVGEANRDTAHFRGPRNLARTCEKCGWPARVGLLHLECQVFAVQL